MSLILHFVSSTFLWLTRPATWLIRGYNSRRIYLFIFARTVQKYFSPEPFENNVLTWCPNTHEYFSVFYMNKDILCLTLCDPHGLQSTRLLCPWNFLGKNIVGGCHFLHQGIFPTQRSNPCLLHFLHWQGDSLPLHHLESLNYNVSNKIRKLTLMHFYYIILKPHPSFNICFSKGIYFRTIWFHNVHVYQII